MVKVAITPNMYVALTDVSLKIAYDVFADISRST